MNLSRALAADFSRCEKARDRRARDVGFGAHRAILTSGSRSSTPRSWKGAVLDPVGGSATARGGSGPAHAGGIQTSSDVGWKDVALANSTAARRAGSGATEPTRESPKTRADLAATPATNARRATVEPTPRASVGSPARNERVRRGGSAEGGDNNKRAEKVGGPGGERTLLRGADDLDAAHGGDTRGRGGAHGGAGDAGAGGEHNGGGGDSGHCRAEWRIGRFGVQSSGVGAFILRRHSTLAPAFSYEHFGENRFESSSPKGQ